MVSTKLETWHRIEYDGGGDFYLVPVGLFDYDLEEAPMETAEDEELYYDKLKQCHYIGGFCSQILIRGEIKSGQHKGRDPNGQDL